MKQQYDALKVYYNQGNTHSVPKRRKHLIRLKKAIKHHEKDLLEAMNLDLGKSKFEGYATEIGMIYQELNYMISNIHELAAPKKSIASIVHFPSMNYIYQEAYGLVLIVSPWNYPVQLCFSPLIGAIAAGNVVALKPSEFAPYCTNIIQTIIEEVFPTDYVHVFQGDEFYTKQLLTLRFDYIFFTGSTRVGKSIMRAACEHLTPVTLELGGKSPCIVEDSANFKIAARRIVWGKFMNAGQTCIAPDYILVSKEKKGILMAYLKQAMEAFYGQQPLLNEEYPKIINQHHFDRLQAFLPYHKVSYGGNSSLESLKIEPTLFDDVSYNDPIMQEEIFGPILPILTYDSIDDVITILQNKEKPLALYLFSSKRAIQKKFIQNVSFGGGCINDTLVHVGGKNVPFGGVGASGMGQYHGPYSFKTFSHEKTILKKWDKLDLSFRYPPYKKKIKLLKSLMK